MPDGEGSQGDGGFGEFYDVVRFLVLMFETH